MKDIIVKKKKKMNLSKKISSNPYLKEVKMLKSTIPNWQNIFCENAASDRINQLIRVEVIGQPLSEKYSWAIPNLRAIKILEFFSPLIEVGCGKGYWAYLLKSKGIDIVAFDRKVKKSCWTEVKKGGPEKLLDKNIVQNRSLFLCYPDENTSLAMNCLENFSGEHVIHVGEIFQTGTFSFPQAPWGRTTSADFQVSLKENFHCLLTASIPSYPFSRDCISVWKRTQWVQGKDIALAEMDPSEPAAEPSVRTGGGEDYWAAIPLEERMPTDSACPKLAHLL